MFKLITFFVKLVIWLLVLLVVCIAGVVLLVNPDNYKTQISSFVEERTGHKLDINGSLKWSLFPHIHVYAQDLVLMDQTGKDKLLETKEATIVIKPIKYLLAVANKKKQEFLLKLDTSVFYGLGAKFNLESTINISFSPKIELEANLQFLPVESKTKATPLNLNIVIDPRQLHLLIDEKTVDMQNVSQIFLSEPLVSGVGAIKVDLVAKTTVNDLKGLFSNLSGNVDLVITNGKLQGIDMYGSLTKIEQKLNTLFNSKQGNIKQSIGALLPNDKPNDNVIGKEFFSAFSNLKLQATFKNGVANDSNLLLQDQSYTVQGSGLIDLAKNNLDYKINAKLNKFASEDAESVTQYMQNIPLLIKVNGPIAGLIFSVDVEEYLQTALQGLQKNLLKSVIAPFVKN